MRFLRRIAAILCPVVEEFNDPAFGSLHRKGGGDWHGEIPFQYPPSGANSMSLLIEAGEGQPSDEQRAFFGEFLARYSELWPRVAEALAAYHPHHTTVESVSKHIGEPCLCLDPFVDDQPRRWSLQYTFDEPNEGDMGYFVEFLDWEIVGVDAAD
jgi:hypothetical protein